MRGALVTILILTVGVGVGPTPVPAAPVSGQPRPAEGNWGASAEAAPLAVNAASVPTSSVSLAATERSQLDFDFEEPRSLWAAESFPAAAGVTPADAQRRETRGVAVDAADLDANGSADLVSFAFQRSGNSTSGYVVVQRTDGFGGVETGTAYLVPLSTDVGDLALADVDGDGDIDVVVATGNVLTIVTLLNDGTGHLSTQLTTPTAEALTRTITLGDVDGDGIADLVGLSGPARGARVYLGNGDGSFRPDATLSQSSPINVALIDADGDGTLEILVTSQESIPQLWRRAGNGTWAVVEGAMPNIFASATWVGDFDGDGDDDVALLLGCVNLESLCLQPLRNNAGVFTALDAVAFQLPIAYFGASHPHIDGLVVDIDGDGRLDLAVPGRGGEIGIIFGVGDGTFAGWRTVNGTTGWEPALAGGWDAAPVSGGVGGFPQNWGTGAAGRGVVAADVTGDGIVDLAAVSGGSPIQRLAGSASGRLTLVEGTGSRGFVGSRAVPFTDRDWRSDRWDDMTTVADWNGDGKADVVAIVRAQGLQPPALVVARGGEGGFAPGEVVGEVDPECVTRTRGQRFLVSDVDGDGALDVVCGGTNLWLARGDGAGGMLAIQELGPTTGSGTDLWGIDAVDMDGDGDLDIAYAASGSLSNMVLGWAENRVGEPAGPPTVGGFAAPAVIGTPDLPAPTTNFYYNGIRPRIVDMTADGLADLVVVSRAQASNGASTSSITVLVNGGHQPDGSFTFTPVRRALAGVDGQSSQIDVLDLDEDGLPDVILSELTSTSSYGDEGWDAVSLRSVGDGTFTPLQTFPVSSSAHGMRRLADLNGDGIGDLIEPTNYRSVQLRAGNGDGTFAPPTIFGTPGFNTPWAEPADFDGDGDLDIVGRTEPFDDDRSFLPNNLVVLENLGGGGPEPTPANLAAVSLEWQPGAGSASDPLTSVTAGHVRIQVTNTGGSRVAGQWTDTVWLSDDATFSVDDTLVLAVPRTGGLAAGATLDGTFDVTIAPHRAGPQHLILRTDVRGQVAETNETDNVVSASPLDFAPPVLARPVGAAPSSGSFTSTGGPVIVRIPAGTGTLRLTVDGGASAVAVREGAVPTATVADDRLAGGTGTVLLLPGGDRYVWLDLPAGATAGLVLENLAFGIGTVSPVIAGNAGPASFTLWGTGLGRVEEARAVSPTGAVLVATNLQPNADGTLAVTFDLDGAATGAYAIEVTDGRATSSLPAAFRVLAARAGTVRTTLFVPGMARPSGTGTTFITFANDGLSDVVAPIYRVRSRGVAAPADGPYPVGDFTVAASVPGAPVGIIPPGASGRIEIPWTQAGASVDGLGPGVATPRGAAYGFLVDEYGPGSIAPYDPAADYADELATLSASDRAAVVDALEDTFGRTGDSYLRAIHAIRSRLARGGTVASDLGTPRRVAFDQAMGQLPGAAVQGAVTDASGDPMTFVRVRVLPAGGDDLFTVTDGAGRFSIRGVPDGTQVEVFLDSHGPTPLATATTWGKPVSSAKRRSKADSCGPTGAM